MHGRSQPRGDDRVTVDRVDHDADQVEVGEVDRVRRLAEQHEQPRVASRGGELVSRAGDDHQQIGEGEVADVVVAAARDADVVDDGHHEDGDCRQREPQRRHVRPHA